MTQQYPPIVQMAIERNYFITIHHQAGVHFENFTEVKFRDILLTGTDRRLNRDSPGQTGTYGRSNFKHLFSILRNQCAVIWIYGRSSYTNKRWTFVLELRQLRFKRFPLECECIKIPELPGTATCSTFENCMLNRVRETTAILQITQASSTTRKTWNVHDLDPVIWRLP